MKPASSLSYGALYLVLAAAFLLVAPAILARRTYDWCRAHPDSVLAAALAGAPFFLLLAVAGLAR